MEIICLVLTLCLAASNGANDNSKGVTTLARSSVTSYKALLWANFSTLAEGALLQQWRGVCSDVLYWHSAWLADSN